jgi:serine/threonine protein kinase
MLTINDHLQQNRYRIIAQIGQDETSVVYVAFDNVLKSNVVIKEFLNLKKVTTVAQQEARKLAFDRDAKLLTELKHDALLQVYRYFSEIDRHYLVMESVDGKDFSELIEKLKKPFTSPNVMNWADQLLDALDYLHSYETPIIHRELNPKNIKLTPTGKTKLLISNLVKTGAAKVTDTAPNQMLDSSDLNYLPLEQIWDGLDPASQKVILNSYDEKSEKILEQPADAQSDIYALSATLYHLVTGQLPVDALTRSIDNLEGKSDPLLPPNQINPNIPTEFSDILLKALEIKREDRFESATAMRQALEPILKLTKERELEARKKQESAHQDIALADQKRLEQARQLVEQQKLKIEADQKQLQQERQLVEQQKLEIETEQKRQEELIKQQLIEAETQRTKAEQRAAEAEQRLFEKDTHTLSSEALALNDEAKFDILAESSTIPTIEANTKPEKASEDFAFLAAESSKSSQGWQKMAIVAALLVVFSGTGFGIWTMMSSKSATSVQTTATQNPSSSEIAQPAESPKESSTTTSLPSVEPTPEINTASSNSAPQTAFENSGKNTTPVKNKTVSTPVPTPIKKPVIAVAKTTPNPKKTLTVDDIINNN